MEAGWKVGDYAVTGDRDTLWQATAQTSGTTVWETIGQPRKWATGELEAKFGPLRKAWIQRERRPGDCPRCGNDRPLGRYGLCAPCIEAEGWAA